MNVLHLFQLGDFTMSSGMHSRFKLECDALTDADVQTLAYLVSVLVGPFASVEGVPRGGLRLAGALAPYLARSGPHLIVDDVLTTGRSLEAARAAYWQRGFREEETDVVGCVVFARGPCPGWVRALCPLPERLWSN